MKLAIDKEICDPVNGKIVGPYYHIFRVDEDGVRTLLETVEGDIVKAIKRGEQLMDFETLQITYQKNPLAFNSTIYQKNLSYDYRSNLPGKIVQIGIEQYEGKVTRVNDEFVAINYKDFAGDNHMMYVKPGKWAMDDEVQILVYQKIKQ